MTPAKHIPQQRQPPQQRPVPDLERARITPHEALAAEVQAHLAAMNITSERQSNEAAALLVISSELIPWFYPHFVQWQSGVENPRRPGTSLMATATASTPPETIARRIAERHREIRAARAGGR